MNTFSHVILIVCFYSAKSWSLPKPTNKFFRNIATVSIATCFTHPQQSFAKSTYVAEPPTVYPSSFGKLVTNNIICQMKEPDLPR